MKARKKILILGAGIAGLSAAWHLRERGIPSRIFEKESEVGGLCRSKHVRGFTFDYSGHLLHFKKPYVAGLVRKLLGKQCVKQPRSAWVSMGERYTPYPFQANLFGLPPKILKECLDGFLRAKKTKRKDSPGKNMNFSQWARRTFGAGIARHFMEPYNAKFWTVPPKELSCDWLSGMVPVPSLRRVLEGAKNESKNQLGYNVYFWYPRAGGIEKLPKAFARRLKDIRLKSGITRIDLDKKEVTLVSGKKEKYDTLISTIPLPEMSRLIRKLPAAIQKALAKLRWNSIYNLNLGVSANGRDPKRHWIYFPQPETCFFRVGFPHHYSSGVAPLRQRSFYAEVSYSRYKAVSKKKIGTRILRDLRKKGLLGPQDRICAKDVNDIRYGYPIYDRQYQEATQKILKFLSGHGIIPCGRYGSWTYMSMEDAIWDGKRAAESL